MHGTPGVFEGAANVIAVLVLIVEFGMLRAALSLNQIRLYAAQSALVSVLAAVVAFGRGVPELYVLAGLSFALKVVVEHSQDQARGLTSSTGYQDADTVTRAGEA